MCEYSRKHLLSSVARANVQKMNRTPNNNEHMYISYNSVYNSFYATISERKYNTFLNLLEKIYMYSVLRL